jgi:hypothetical protein
MLTYVSEQRLFHAAVFLEINKPQPIVLFEKAKGWLSGRMPDVGEMHRIRTLTDHGLAAMGETVRAAAWPPSIVLTDGRSTALAVDDNTEPRVSNGVDSRMRPPGFRPRQPT